MNLQILTGSRIVAFHQLKRNWVKHEQRLIKIKPTINTRPSLLKTLSSRKVNLQNNLQLQFQNKALLNKLTDRIKQSNNVSLLSQSTRCLQKNNRKRYYEQYKLRSENEGLYRRLKNTKPVINNNTLMKQRLQNERYLNTISKFGYGYFKPNKSILKFQMTNNQLKYKHKQQMLFNESSQYQSRLSQNQNCHKLKQNEQSANQKQQYIGQLPIYLKTFRPFKIENEKVYIKVGKQKSGLLMELKRGDNKQNNQQIFEIQIPWHIYETKYRKVQKILQSLRYNKNQETFYLA